MLGGSEAKELIRQTRPIVCLGVTEMVGSQLAKEAVGLLSRGGSIAWARGNLSLHLTSPHLKKMLFH